MEKYVLVVSATVNAHILDMSFYDSQPGSIAELSGSNINSVFIMKIPDQVRRDLPLREGGMQQREKHGRDHNNDSNDDQKLLQMKTPQLKGNASLNETYRRAAKFNVVTRTTRFIPFDRSLY